MIRAYYNENDPKIVPWLRDLIARGDLMDGDVDERSIEEVSPADLKGYTRHHFFAGVGAWDLALQFARWPDETPVWTGSCPCQSISSAGKRRGHDDERHLWPSFHRLIAECRPAVAFGEQVAGPIGREWIAGVRLDLEALGYACGIACLPAASIGAPHKRYRSFWVADAEGAWGCLGRQDQEEPGGSDASGGDAVAHSHRRGWAQGREPIPAARRGSATIPSGQADPAMAYANGKGLQGHRGSRHAHKSPPWQDGPVGLAACLDGCYRRVPIEPPFFPLAHGTTDRVVRLRGYGNAIIPHLAARFVTAYME